MSLFHQLLSGKSGSGPGSSPPRTASATGTADDRVSEAWSCPNSSEATKQSSSMSPILFLEAAIRCEGGHQRARLGSRGDIDEVSVEWIGAQRYGCPRCCSGGRRLLRTRVRRLARERERSRGP